MAILTDEKALEIVEKRQKHLHKSPTLTPSGKTDREYLLGMLEIFVEQTKHKVIEGEVPHKTLTFTYKPSEMFISIIKMFKFSIEYGQPLTITSMSWATGMDREYLSGIACGNINGTGTIPKEYEFLADCRKFVENYNEYAAHKKQNPAGPIFILKNFGWKDKLEIEASATQGALTAEEREIAQKRIQQFSETRC